MADVRRVTRAVTIAEAMAKHPGHSIPQLFEQPYEVKAAYHLFNLEEATPDCLQAGHRTLVRQRLSQAGTYLLLEDTSELAWHNCAPHQGLGPLCANSDRYQGLHLHSVLAVQWTAWPLSQGRQRPPVKIIGLCDQQYHIRQRRPDGEPDDASYARKKRQRESQLWEQATQRIGPKPPDGTIRWVRVCDRGADIYEHLDACQKHGHGFVIRSSQDRAVVASDTGQNGDHLFATAQAAPLLGHLALELRARPRQPARIARLGVSATRVALRAPQRPGCSAGRQAPIHCSVIRVWEMAAPAGVEPLEWVLLCDQEVTEFEMAHACVLQYATRWLIEEFHKALKTGVGVERLQLKTAHRLFAAIALLSIVALRLLDLREHLRVAPAQPAQKCRLKALELQVLRLQSGRSIETVQDVALALGRLGGHLNRKGDGMPGWQVLWRGILWSAPIL